LFGLPRWVYLPLLSVRFIVALAVRFFVTARLYFPFIYGSHVRLRCCCHLSQWYNIRILLFIVLVTLLFLRFVAFCIYHLYTATLTFYARCIYLHSFVFGCLLNVTYVATRLILHCTFVHSNSFPYYTFLIPLLLLLTPLPFPLPLLLYWFTCITLFLLLYLPPVLIVLVLTDLCLGDFVLYCSFAFALIFCSHRFRVPPPFTITYLLFPCLDSCPPPPSLIFYVVRSGFTHFVTVCCTLRFLLRLRLNMVCLHFVDICIHVYYVLLLFNYNAIILLDTATVTHYCYCPTITVTFITLNTFPYRCDLPLSTITFIHSSYFHTLLWLHSLHSSHSAVVYSTLVHLLIPICCSILLMWCLNIILLVYLFVIPIILFVGLIHSDCRCGWRNGGGGGKYSWLAAWLLSLMTEWRRKKRRRGVSNGMAGEESWNYDYSIHYHVILLMIFCYSLLLIFWYINHYIYLALLRCCYYSFNCLSFTLRYHHQIHCWHLPTLPCLPLFSVVHLPPRVCICVYLQFTDYLLFIPLFIRFTTMDFDTHHGVVLQYTFLLRYDCCCCWNYRLGRSFVQRAHVHYLRVTFSRLDFVTIAMPDLMYLMWYIGILYLLVLPLRYSAIIGLSSTLPFCSLFDILYWYSVVVLLLDYDLWSLLPVTWLRNYLPYRYSCSRYYDCRCWQLRTLRCRRKKWKKKENAESEMTKKSEI